MEPDTVDQNYAQLQQQATENGQLIQALAGKLQAAGGSGDANANGWLVDLKQIAVGIQQEQSQVTLLLQSIHQLVSDHVAATSAPQPPPAQFQQQAPPAQYQQQAPGFMGGGARGGGRLQQFLGGGFGQAMISGAGFGIGANIINRIL